MGIWSFVFDYIKGMAADYVDSAKDQFSEILKRIYRRIMLSIGSTLMFCFSLSALVQKIADSLDKETGFVWLNSMTLYSIVSIVSLSIIYFISKKHKRHIHHAQLDEESIESKIASIIQDSLESIEPTPKRRKPRARKTKKESESIEP